MGAMDVLLADTLRLINDIIKCGTMKKIFFLLFLGTTLLACKSDDDDNNTNNPYLTIPPVNLNLNLLESWGIIMIGVMAKNFYDEYKK